MQPGVLVELASGGGAGLTPKYGASAFKQHQRADNAEKYYITKAHKQIDLTNFPQKGKQHDAHAGTGEAANGENDTHLEIDIAPTGVCQNTGDRGCNDLIGLRGDRDRGRDADEDQKRGHQEPTTHAKKSRQETHAATHQKDQEDVDRHFGNG